MLASRDVRGAFAVRSARVRRMAVLVIAACALVSSVAWANETPKTSAPAAPTLRAPKPTATTKTTPAKAATVKPVAAPAAAPAAVRPTGGTMTMPAGKPGKTAKASKTQLASMSPSGAPVVVPATPSPAQAPGSTLAHLDDHLTYQYNTLGRRDPFQSLVDGAFVAADQGGQAVPDIGGVKVVGIVWGAADQFALVEDARGNSFVLRKGDKIQNGYVEGLKRDGVIVNLTADGQSQTVIIPLTKKGEQK